MLLPNLGELAVISQNSQTAFAFPKMHRLQNSQNALLQILQGQNNFGSFGRTELKKVKQKNSCAQGTLVTAAGFVNGARLWIDSHQISPLMDVKGDVYKKFM